MHARKSNATASGLNEIILSRFEEQLLSSPFGLCWSWTESILETSNSISL